jgi:hypothetical protein
MAPPRYLAYVGCFGGALARNRPENCEQITCFSC